MKRTGNSVAIVTGTFVLALALVGVCVGQVQEKVLYSFCSDPNCTDGAAPHGILAFDRAGNLYGTTAGGGSNCQQGGGCGTVFQLSPSNGTWTETVLYNFCVNNIQNCPDGYGPLAGLRFDKAGNLYGTTQNGGSYGLGTVFELSPPVDPGGAWTETVLWSFGAKGDGKYPLSRLTFDSTGNLYGTTSQGGSGGYGTVFQLVTPKIPGAQWSENILYAFGADHLNGGNLQAGVSFDSAGNLYGTTLEGGSKEGSGLGVVYKLTPAPQLPWTETVLFRFTKQSGGNPLSAVNFDQFGNLYVTASAYAAHYGSVIRLSPQGGGRVRAVPFLGAPDGANPGAGVFIQGNVIYGTTQAGGANDGGALFKIQGGKESVLYSFCSQPNCADGYQPQAALVSRNGSLFGTTWFGGANGKGGVVFQISMPKPTQAKTTSRKSSRAPTVRPVKSRASQPHSAVH